MIVIVSNKSALYENAHCMYFAAVKTWAHSRYLSDRIWSRTDGSTMQLWTKANFNREVIFYSK